MQPFADETSSEMTPSGAFQAHVSCRKCWVNSVYIQQGTHCTNICKLAMIRNEPNQVFDAIAGTYIYLIGDRGLRWMEKSREGHEATLGRRE
jgi:hypothetical protein